MPRLTAEKCWPERAYPQLFWRVQSAAFEKKSCCCAPCFLFKTLSTCL